MKRLTTIPLLPLLVMSGSPPALSQIQGAPIVVDGKCTPDSGVSIDNETNSHFDCDTAVAMRTQRGTVLIQFTDKRGDDGRILGFAGTIEGKQGFGADTMQIMAVERIYLSGGTDPIPAIRGTCIMNWTGLHRTGGRLTSVLCAGRGMAEGKDIKAMAVLKVR
jgi:hypothetical protein